VNLLAATGCPRRGFVKPDAGAAAAATIPEGSTDHWEEAVASANAAHGSAAGDRWAVKASVEARAKCREEAEPLWAVWVPRLVDPKVPHRGP
jgi:hypothetical protein